MKLYLGVAIVALTARAVVAQPSADPAPLPPPPPEDKGNLDLSYLYDGGAIPFFWGALATRLALDKWTKPRSSPLFFSEHEGGAPKASWEVPGYAVTGLGVLTGGLMLAGGDESRMYHVKGLAESLMTGCVVTGLIKVAVGRHRPDWTEANDGSAVQSRSFPSGHSTQAFAIATYAILYLRGHVFDTRDAGWLEYATYAGIGLGAAAVAGERVWHNRHHLSDVMVGGLLGTASSMLFYRYQEGRFDDHKAKEGLRSLTITPSVTPQGATVGFSFVF